MSLFSKKSATDTAEEVPPAKPEKPKQKPKYGIDTVMELMRTLPLEKEPELIVLVVKNTLRSMNIDLRDIISDAETEEKTVREQIAKLRKEIADLESRVARHKEDVAAREAHLSETTRVKQRLQAVVSPNEPSILPPGSVSSAAPKGPLPSPAKPKPLTSARPAAGRDTMELRPSEIDVQPTGAEAPDKKAAVADSA